MSNLNPLVSILITNYNFDNLISDSIDSALNQVYSPIEIIVVDDGSTDKSRDIISHFGEKVIPVYKENGGQSSAWNAGFQWCQGDIVCFLDSDDIFLPEKVSKVVRRMTGDKEIGWYFNRHKIVDIRTWKVLAFTPLKRTGTCDIRSEIIRGRNSIYGPATSGLCFERLLLNQLFPVPEEKNNSITEEYLRVVAIYLAKGYMDTEPLSIKREHDENKYSSKTLMEKLPLLARKKISNAYWLRKKWGPLHRYTNKMFSHGISIYNKLAITDQNYYLQIKDYYNMSSLQDNLEIGFYYIYYRFFWNQRKISLY